MKTLTRREQAIFGVGFLGYDIDSLSTMDLLLEDNVIEDIKEFYYKLEALNIRDNQCSFISLAGNYPKIKLKGGNFDKVFDLIEKCNIKISIE